MIGIELYIITVIFSMIIVVWSKYKIQSDPILIDRILHSDSDSSKNIQHPLMYVFIPIINIIFDFFMIWILTTDINNVRKFFE
ncbi:hypothetical protein ACFHWD_03480 [Clostridium sp. MT-14]|uniref:hypothetical protein n=1 Tax=Clostridium sp. MT-14 TaxID=3348360 RepID=UPI0035F2C910